MSKELKVLHSDVKAKVDAKKSNDWFYSDTVKDHFFNPRNFLRDKHEVDDFDGYGDVGSVQCGDRMCMWIKINKKEDKIIDCKFQTFGCGSAIASTSVLTVMITENSGMKIDDALKIKPQDIVNRLEELPLRKYHCSVLGDKALRSAINDYFKKTKQYSRVVEAGAKMIDLALKITDKDIEEAVLEGAVTFEDLQKKTKLGVQDKTCIPEAKQLLKFYREKYFGKEA